ncbi:hypothetical protein PHYBOEH_008804 [Phytophthora boehmeriae]|uniref:BZIP domain-containing protein n=1 Tax=Phytophthora boehmeriae TaxID=109152 RepID=A0A8T1W1F2_9STRA|nr:hypothetical protein PHYBOEH_008804 [Phytophthora boehmeriae]
MARLRKPSAADLETRRRKNREFMRKARQQQREELHEMAGIVVQLEEQYAELCRRSASATQAVDVASNYQCSQNNGDYAVAVELIKRLGAEKLLLQTMIQQKVAWTRQLQRILDFEASNRQCMRQLPGMLDASAKIDMLDADQAAEELGFHPLTEWDLTRIILDNKWNMGHVQNHLLAPPELDTSSDTRTRRMQAFGWDIVQRVDGGVMECVFTKRFSGLDIRGLMQRTWSNDMQLAKFRKIKAETRRLQVLQQMNPHAYVLIRDVYSPTAISTFRSVFVRFLVEASKELPPSAGDANCQTLTGTGYVLGTQSVGTDHVRIMPGDENLAWAGLALSIEAFDVVDSSTGETYQQIRWTGSNDYGSEEHAQRNAADTMQGVLRWEMLVIAPALNLVSLNH